MRRQSGMDRTSLDSLLKSMLEPFGSASSVSASVRATNLNIYFLSKNPLGTCVEIEDKILL